MCPGSFNWTDDNDAYRFRQKFRLYTCHEKCLLKILMYHFQSTKEVNCLKFNTVLYSAGVQIWVWKSYIISIPRVRFVAQSTIWSTRSYLRKFYTSGPGFRVCPVYKWTTVNLHTNKCYISFYNYLVDFCTGSTW